MPKQPKTTDPTDWHRAFAMTANDRAWTLAEQTARTAAEDEEMLNTAHAAAYHWNAIGTELHHMRAKMLLAQVHAIYAHAAHVVGKTDLHRESYAEAERAIDTITAEKEREIVLATFTTVPNHES